MKNSFLNVLFVTWDGPDVNYLENLFSPIFYGLQIQYDYKFHVFQFTSASKEKILQRKVFFDQMNIAYSGIQLSGGNPIWNLMKVKFWYISQVSRYIRKHSIQVVMPRAVTSFYLIKPLIAKYRLKLVWDADGFPLDERVDFNGLSPVSIRYRFFRDQEFQGFHFSHAIICRSIRAKEIIRARAGSGFISTKVFVVNNGIVNKNGNQSIRETSRDEIHLVYAGSSGPQYRIPQILTLFRSLHKKLPQLRLNIYVYKAIEIKQLVSESFPDLVPYLLIKTVEPKRIPNKLAKASIGIAFREPSFSMQGVAPIKVSEYLAAGLSILYTPGSGDLDQLLADQPFAFCYSDEIDEEVLVSWIKDQSYGFHKGDVRQFALKNFGLDRTLEVYHQALQYGE